MPKPCAVCGQTVVHKDVLEELDYIFEQVDSYGETSLTEEKQMVYLGRICSAECYEEL